MGRCQKVPKFDFQSQFSTSKIIGIFLIFFFIEEYQFRSTFFVIDIFITSIFKSLYFLTRIAIIYIAHNIGRDGWVGFSQPEFGVSVKPSPTRGADYAHHVNACPPVFENLTTFLQHSPVKYLLIPGNELERVQRVH